MSLSVSGGDLVWVFPKGRPGKVYPAGSITLDRSEGCDHYSVVVLEKNGHMLESKGHTYIAIGYDDHYKPSEDPIWEKPSRTKKDTREFKLSILDTKKDEQWQDATRTYTGYKVTVKAKGCLIWDPTDLYEKHARAIIQETIEFVSSQCDYDKSIDCYGFGRFSILRSSQSSIPLPAAYGVLDVTDSHITQRLWTVHVNLAQQQLGVARPTTVEQWENLFTLALTSFGYVMPWTKEQRDNITTELFFGTQQDCEDQASRVLAVINHIRKSKWHLTGVEETLFNMCQEIDEAYIASCWADPKTSCSDLPTRAGHCVCVIKRKGVFQILECTSAITPYSPGTRYNIVDGAILNPPRVIELDRYLKFSYMANSEKSFFVGEKAKDKFAVGVTDLNKPFEKLYFCGKHRTLHDVLFKNSIIMPCVDPEINSNLKTALVSFKKLFPHLFVEGSASDHTAHGAVDVKVPVSGKGLKFQLPFITLFVVEPCEPST